MEIAGKDPSSVEQQRARESEREIWVEKREMGRQREAEKEGGREREEGGEGGACLRRTVCQTARSVCLLGELAVRYSLKRKMCKSDVFSFQYMLLDDFIHQASYMMPSATHLLPWRDYVASPQTSLSLGPIFLSCSVLRSADGEIQQVK